MTLQVGDSLPEATFKTLGPEGMSDVSTRELTQGKKVVLFAVPGAFTPTCSDQHLPGFMDRVAEIKAKGVDTVACIAANDAFVLNAWRQQRSIPEDIILLSDGNLEFTEAADLVLDISAFGMGKRSARYAAIIDDGQVTYLGVEPGREVGVSSAEAVLENL